MNAGLLSLTARSQSSIRHYDDLAISDSEACQHEIVDHFTRQHAAPQSGHFPRGKCPFAGASQGVPQAAPGLDLSQAELTSVVVKKATCPFIGSAVSTGALAVRQGADTPLASIEDVRQLGNSGGGDLGELLVVFATGNHALMPGESGQLDKKVSSGLFSLDFPGSQGSHPGHSGILQGDPEQLDSGRFSQHDFDRLEGHAQHGLLKRSDVGRFIAENLILDPKSKVFGLKVAGLLAGDLVDFVQTIGPALLTKITGTPEEEAAAHRQLEVKLTALLGEDNLVGSAGEFGLLFAFLANKPNAEKVDGEPAVSLADVKSMFVDKQLPVGWQNWKKTRLSWVANTTGLLISAGKAYLELKQPA